MDQGKKVKEISSWPEPDSIQGLAKEVVSVLGARPLPTQSVRMSVLDKLITHVLTRGLFDAERVASMLRAQRLGEPDVVDIYIPNAARRLGAMWTEDLIGFAEVSIGAARLQALAHEISSKRTIETAANAPQEISFLITALQGEDHTLGCVSVCTMLRRQGHHVDLRLGATPESLLAELSAQRHDAVLMSCSRPEGLASLSKLILDIRQRMVKAPVLAIGGVVLDHAGGEIESTGADLVTRDIKQVIKLAVSFRKSRISLVK